MIKLVRNTFGSQKYLTDMSGNQIDWNFLVKLVDIQSSQGLHLATKIRPRHLQWAREKMKVKIATQTLSKSVADALLYLGEDLKLPSFKDIKATSIFVQMFNDLFDVFNSRNRFAKYLYRRPLSPSTAHTFFQFLDQVTIYISNLKLADVAVLNSPRKTGFLGFLICIQSLRGLYSTYVEKLKYMKYILTNKLSQDHLELFFGAIRGKGGFNNSPSARHFEAAYKRLLVHTEISGPSTGNISHSENLTILSCGSGQQVTVDEHGENLLNSKEFIDFKDAVSEDISKYSFSSSAWDLTIYAEKKVLKKCVTCSQCCSLLEGDIVISKLQQRKQYGSLVNASKVVIEICSAAEKYFRFFHKTTNIFNKNIKNLIDILILNTLKTLSPKILQNFENHLYDYDPLDGHVMRLIKLILCNYFNLRIHHEATKQQELSKTLKIRSIFTKTILFKHQ
ncbi:unnamed protein product [Acanthoscelides obtectus]|uniref:Uncharacterized protein n=1 Tax=Acanthoscelides obtectus TaxID=200917 RepID=A0A9P0LU78_ACAOB|nr:unnamed protein product [Acanthoscelides obtectus]CAK1656264.1 DNA transposase THAP9 [Acanthoscelides obtectus]